MPPPRRDVGPLLHYVREFLLGRKWKGLGGQLRFEDVMSPRPGPQPNIPIGPADKISANYYYLRDARRDAEPPTTLVRGSNQKQLPAKTEGDAATKTTSSTWPAPGKEFKWAEAPRD